MDEFVVILGLLITVLIVILVFNKYNSEKFSLCEDSNRKGFFGRMMEFLDDMFFNKKSDPTKPVLDNSFTVPADERNNLMYGNGENYFWSWQ